MARDGSIISSHRTIWSFRWPDGTLTCNVSLLLLCQKPRAQGRMYVGEITTFPATSRYLNKLYSQQLPISRLPDNVCYLATDYPTHASCGVQSEDQFMDPHTQLEAYRQRARR